MMVALLSERKASSNWGGKLAWTNRGAIQ